MRCDNCDSEVMDGHRYCFHCGMPLPVALGSRGTADMTTDQCKNRLAELRAEAADHLE
jgi:hypothetical protein